MTKDSLEILIKVYEGVLEEKRDHKIKEKLESEFKEAKIESKEVDLMIKAAKKAQELEKGKDYILGKR